MPRGCWIILSLFTSASLGCQVSGVLRRRPGAMFMDSMDGPLLMGCIVVTKITHSVLLLIVFVLLLCWLFIFSLIQIHT